MRQCCRLIYVYLSELRLLLTLAFHESCKMYFWQVPRGHGECVFPEAAGWMGNILHNFSLRSLITNQLNTVTRWVTMELLPFFPIVHQGAWIPTQACLCNIAPSYPPHTAPVHTSCPLSTGCAGYGLSPSAFPLKPMLTDGTNEQLGGKGHSILNE